MRNCREARRILEAHMPVCTFEASHAYSSQQHSTRQPCHNLHNCRTTSIQPNVPLRPAIILTRPAQQTPCNRHLLISIPKDQERNRPYHLEARHVA